MDRETFSQYGWMIIIAIVAMIMVSLATPFGDYVFKSINNTSDSLYKAAVVQNAEDGEYLVREKTDWGPAN